MKEKKRIKAYNADNTKRRAAWDKENMKVLAVKLHRRNDADILAVLDKTENISGFIRQALRAYIEKPS